MLRHQALASSMRTRTLEIPEMCSSSSSKQNVGKCSYSPHEVLHAGLPTCGQSKWILRTDIVFRRAWASTICMPLRNNWRYSREYHAALMLWYAAFDHELNGNLERASHCYRECLELRTNQSFLVATTTTIGAVLLPRIIWTFLLAM